MSVTMGCSVLLITLTVFLSSLGSLVQSTHSVNISNLVWKVHSTGRSQHVTDRLARDVIDYSESSRDSTEGSGQSVHSAQQTLINKTPVLNEPVRNNIENHSASGIRSLAFKPPEGHDQEADKSDASVSETSRHSHSHGHTVSEGTSLEGGQIKAEEQLNKSQTFIVNESFLGGGHRLRLPTQTSVFNYKADHSLSGPGGSCLPGLCVILPNFNGTSLLWDDMKRTLAFAWELHVFGSASLFIMITLLAILGIAGACTLPHPLSEALTLTNSLLVMSGTLRAVLLLLDPYGTRLILSRASLTALHNVSLQLLLWTQVILALVTLRRLKLLFFPLELQHLWVFGGLTISHCTLLLVADLYSSVLPLSFPLLLQTLSLCWAIPFCMGIITKSVNQLPYFLSSPVPHWVPSHRLERHAKRVTSVCALLGVLCCSLQTYSLFWLYGLLGNWRRFSWGWWLSQFWARILELCWGFSLLVLGSWVFWTPSRYHYRGNTSKGGKESNLQSQILSRVRIGPLRKSEKAWEDLMPNNWAKYNLSRAGIINNFMCPYDNQPSTPQYKFDHASNSCDSQAALMWQKVSEHECVLSLVEFDMYPPSPINLRHSIDNALHHGQLVARSLFTPPPLSWTRSVARDNTDGDMFPPAYVGSESMVDTESIPASLDYFQTKESEETPSASNDGNDMPNNACRGEDYNSGLSAVMHAYDWFDDDVTDL